MQNSAKDNQGKQSAGALLTDYNIENKEKLVSEGFQFFDYIEPSTKDTILMQQYFVAFLNKGLDRSHNKEEIQKLQEEHLSYLSKMYHSGYADLFGPFNDNGNLRGITIYNVPTLKMADSLAKADPMVKSGRLEVEVKPWWGAKGFPLR